MTRARNAAITAAFSYVQYALAIASGFVLVPLTLAHVGARPWGLWLASGEILNYAGMVDLGILAVLPWMLAEADGRGDRDRMRRLVSQGVWIGAIVGVGYVAVAAMLWRLLPSALFLTPADRALVAVPLAVVVVATMLRYPLAAFRAVLTGLQDVVFNGFVSMVQAALSFTLTVALLLNGYGLFALAYA